MIVFHSCVHIKGEGIEKRHGIVGEEVADIFHTVHHSNMAVGGRNLHVRIWNGYAANVF